MITSDRSTALDSNLLLLYLVSRDNRLLHLIGSWKRLSMFDRQDALRLSQVVARSRLLLTTPHVLTEASNFIGQLAEPARSVLLETFKTYIIRAEEQSIAAEVLIQNVAFIKLRLTDCALLELPPQCTVLTIDFHLSAQRRRTGGLATNFSNGIL